MLWPIKQRTFVSVTSWTTPAQQWSKICFFPLSLRIRQSAKRNHHLWYLKRSPSTMLHYAVYSALTGAAEIFHYYSVFCLYSPPWLCLEVNVSILVKGLFVYLNPLLFLLGQERSGHWVSVTSNETEKLSSAFAVGVLFSRWYHDKRPLNCTTFLNCWQHTTHCSHSSQRWVITCSHCMNKSHSCWI